MAFDREAAKADGYTDQEIDEYLASEGKPLPAETPIDRSEEKWGVAQAVAPDVLKYGAEGYLAKKVLFDPLAKAIKGPTGTTPPSNPGATNRILGDLASGAGQAPAEVTPPKTPMGFVDTNAPRMGPAPTGAAPQLTQGAARPAMTALPGVGSGPAPAAMPEAPPSSANYMARMTQLADQYLPAAKQAAGAAGRVIAPVARVLSSAPALGAQLMLHSPGLNANEDEELRRRRAQQPTFTFPQQ